MKTTLTTLLVGLSTLCFIAQTNIATSNFIKVDQFGYLPNATKVAVISNPQTGFNAEQSFTAGTTYQVRNWQNGSVVFSGSPQSWNGGATHTQSGDKGWWFDFSTVNTIGSYYIYDVSNNVRSYQFNINDDVYSPVLKAATRMFYYNRCNFAKQAPYAEPGFTDGVAFSNQLQDGNSRYVFDKNNAATEKDLSGGWFDAGDFNKYVTFADRVMHDLLSAYQENPNVFTDDFNIPESGNGIPDILDELKWELDWLMKMNNTDGSTHLKIGSQNYSENTATPPSSNTDPRYYGPTCTSAAISVAGVFAHASKVFATIPAFNTYAQQLRNKAINTWNYVVPFINSNQLDTACDNGEIISGDADWDAATQRKKALKAAIYLFDLTGSNTYHQFIITNANTIAAAQISNAYWDVYEMPLNDALLLFSSLPNANTELKNAIRNSLSGAVAGNSNNFFGFTNADLYRAFMPNNAYHWGSNLTKAGYGVLNTVLVNNNINAGNQAAYQLKAAEQLHYFHGVNPLNLVYLTNMKCYGAENSVSEVYHQWFLDGSDWDSSLTSLYGPAPGYVPGGPNKDFSLSSPTPPAGQPAQKSYANFNTGFPTNSWEITEPAIYYQSIYVRLLANYAGQQMACAPVGAACDDGNPATQNDIENGFCCCEGSINPSANCLQIIDGTFDTDLLNWYWWNCTPVISNGECTVNNIVAGSNPWDAAIAQSDLIFEQGKQYEISFDARAAIARTISVKAGLSIAPFDIYNLEDINITTTMQTYSVTFTMTNATSFSGSLEFYMGTDATSLVLDNIVIQNLNCCPAAGTTCNDGDANTNNDIEDGNCNCTGTPPQPADCNQIINGTFDTNIDDWVWWNCDPYSSSGLCYIGSIVPGANPWDAALAQQNKYYEQGKQYEISFNGFAPTNRTINVKIALGVSPYTNYQNEVISLTSSNQNFIIDFTMANPTTNKGSLEFYLGGISGDVILDNILLTEVGCASSVCQSSLTINGSANNFMYQASQSINSAAAISPNGNVHFHAGDRIQLGNNFSVPANATFRAAIEPCGTAAD